MSKKKIREFFVEVFSKLIKAISLEKNTKPGKVNLFADIILSIVAVFILLTDSVIPKIFSIISCMISGQRINSSTSYSPVVLFSILAGFAIVCLVFVYISEKIKNEK